MILDRVEGQDAGSLSVPLHVASGPTLLEEGEHVLARRRQWLLPMGHCSRLWGYQQHSRHLRDQGCSKHRRNGRDLGMLCSGGGGTCWVTASGLGTSGRTGAG